MLMQLARTWFPTSNPGTEEADINTRISRNSSAAYKNREGWNNERSRANERAKQLYRTAQLYERTMAAKELQVSGTILAGATSITPHTKKNIHAPSIILITRSNLSFISFLATLKVVLIKNSNVRYIVCFDNVL